MLMTSSDLPGTLSTWAFPGHNTGLLQHFFFDLGFENLANSLWKTAWLLLKKLNIELLYEPALPLLSLQT